ncbi:AAA family ATPase [Candidatus Micrarchaeota archaeon]|nr:AAA family ATPase [Candidatus Micrarchaeota archaeon]
MDDRRLYATFLNIRERLGRSFVNQTPLFVCGDKQFTINDIVSVAIMSGTNMYLIGSRGSGKTLLAETMRRSVFGDRGLYLRGDVNLNLKDLFMRINLQGKTDAEIYQVAETLKYHFALIDELNRVPGVLQNQFLNLLDGYVEIRGQKYYLGSDEYMLAVATGNPPINGEHPGVFEEDIALLDRIPLIINVDEVEHCLGDIASIMAADVEKSRLPLGDLTADVIGAHRYLSQKRLEDPDVLASVALLSEFAYSQFRYVTVSQKRLDKAQDDGWRDHLIGEHDGGKAISYVSDVSVRTLKHAARLGFAIFKVASAEAELMRSQGVSVEPVGYKNFLGSFFDSLRLALTYDRRFIPAELPKQLDKTHAEVLTSVFTDLSNAMDFDSFQDAGILLTEFFTALRGGDDALAQKVAGAVSKAVGENPALESAYGIMEAEMRKKGEAEKDALLRAALSGSR